MKILKVFVLIFIFTLILLKSSSLAYSQDSPVPPTNPPVPCNSTALTEFHSLRPYQANAECQTKTADYATFCGNTLTIQETIRVTYNPGVDNCTSIGGGYVRCDYIKIIAPHTITINLTGANLPIMGNTEEVTNYKGEPDQYNDAKKVNEYVSWYLNGVINRAEYSPLDVTENCIGNSQVAGVCLDTTAAGMCILPIPIVQGIPDPLLKADGTSTCGGVKSCCVTINPSAPTTNILDRDKLINYSGPINKLLPQEVAQQARAETVLNANKTRHDQIVGCTYGINIPFLGELGGIPAECYHKGEGFFNWVVGKIEGALTRKHRLSEWEGHLPPERYKFDNYAEYYKAYQSWRGKMCFAVPLPNFIPIIGGMNVMLCGEDIRSPNYYSELYPYIPLSSTEDLKGNIKVESLSADTAGVTNITFNNQVPSDLFFSHVQESTELGSILQNTYLAKDEAEIGPDTAVEPPTSCKTVDVRSNKGDDLFPTPLKGDLGYTASFSCNFKTRGQQIADGDCTLIPIIDVYSCPPQSCSKAISISLSTQSNSPEITNVWSRLVAGPTAVVKRMFPKLGGQIGTLKDMPGSTSITYSGSSGQLNIPHLGGISEYFLKGIQTMLRPKGYGEPITFGAGSPNPTVGDCGSAPVQIPTDGTITKELLAIDAPSGNRVLECYDYVVTKSKEAGITPAFTLLLWLNESGCSSNPALQDFGINSSLVSGLFAQLDYFLTLPDRYLTDYSSCFGGGYDTRNFFGLYHGDGCAPGVPTAGQGYLDYFKLRWYGYTHCPAGPDGYPLYPFKSSCF